MKKNSKSPMKKEQKAKRAKAQRPVQREAKEVLAELVEKMRGKLEVKSTSASQAEAGPRGELSPNLNRLTVGVDLGDQRSHFCTAKAEKLRIRNGRKLRWSNQKRLDSPTSATCRSAFEASGTHLYRISHRHREVYFPSTRPHTRQPSSDLG